MFKVLMNNDFICVIISRVGFSKSMPSISLASHSEVYLGFDCEFGGEGSGGNVKN